MAQLLAPLFALFVDAGDGKAHRHIGRQQHRLAKLQAGFGGFRHGFGNAFLIKLGGMPLVTRARHNPQMRHQPACSRNHPVHPGAVHGDGERECILNAAMLEEIRPIGRAVENRPTKFAVPRDKPRIHIHRDIGNAALFQHIRHNLPHAPEARDDDMALQPRLRLCQ